MPSYTIIGDIAVVNVKNEDELSGARELAIEIASKSPNIKSVYAKLCTETEFRIAKLIHLWGEHRTYTIAREYGVEFIVDIAKAYYNPRLSSERRRVAEEVSDGEVVLDMFCGVGGFTLHIACLKNCTIYANDINRSAIKMLIQSIVRNRRRIKSSIYVLNIDSKMLPEVLQNNFFDRIIMDNPTRPLEFIEASHKLARKNGVIHVYFLYSRGCEQEFVDEVKKQYPDLKEQVIKEVYEYSPSKSIYRVDFVKA